jgi:hypothetical protein
MWANMLREHCDDPENGLPSPCLIDDWLSDYRDEWAAQNGGAVSGLPGAAEAQPSTRRADPLHGLVAPSAAQPGRGEAPPPRRAAERRDAGLHRTSEAQHNEKG